MPYKIAKLRVKNFKCFNNKKYYEFGPNKNEQAFKSYWDRVKNKK